MPFPLKGSNGTEFGAGGLAKCQPGGGAGTKYSGPNLRPSPPNHAGALSPGVGCGLGSLGAEQAEVSGVEGQEEALGPGTFVEPLSAAAQCFLSFHLELRCVQKLWKASFSPKEKTGTGEALGAQGTPDSRAPEAGLLPSSLAPEARPGYQPPPTPLTPRVPHWCSVPTWQIPSDCRSASSTI